MPVSTTQSIWRSGGGDTTRQAYCGSGIMAAGFYVANAAVSGNAVVASGQTAQVILPANAVVTSVVITSPLTSGTMNVGFVTVTGSATNTAYLAQGAAASKALTITPGSTGNGAGLGTVMSANVNTVLTTESASSATGSVGGYVTYYVTDYLFGQQNV